MGEDLGDRPVLDGVAATHHEHLVGDVRHDAHVVRDEQHRQVALAAQGPEQVEDPRLHRDVESRRRLVRDERDRVPRERHRDHRPLQLPAGQLVRVRLPDPRRVGEAGGAEQLVDPRRDPRTIEGRRVRGDRLGDLGADREDGREGVHRLLEDHADARATDRAELVVRGTDELGVPEPDAAGDPGLRREQPEHAHRAHGLARPGLADEGEYTAGRQGEGDVTDDGLRVAERDAEPLDLEQR
ncbi:hypothetical protein GCM10017714_00210 [Curtobacterium pusillum]